MFPRKFTMQLSMKTHKGSLEDGFRIEVGIERLHQARQIHNDARICRLTSLALNIVSVGLLTWGGVNLISGEISVEALTALMGTVPAMYASTKLSNEACKQLEEAHRRIEKSLEEINSDDDDDDEGNSNGSEHDRESSDSSHVADLQYPANLRLPEEDTCPPLEQDFQPVFKALRSTHQQ
jgi:ABC-type transport system involved in cytochrome bd biosynthesis fused ATPase/permease subunit